MRWIFAVVMCLPAVACGNSESDPTDTGGATCAQRSGTYVVTFVANSGNCGAIDQSTLVIDAQPTAPDAPCTGTLSYTADNCTVTIQQMCPLNVANDPATGLVEAGDAHWSVDGSTGTATLEVSATDSTGAQLCAGEYTASYARN